MEYYRGIDVSLERSNVRVVDTKGSIVREATVASDPDALIAWFFDLGLRLSRIGLEAGPLSQWLYAGLAKAGFAIELLETRHVRDAFKAMPIKTDKKDARGIAQLMRLGWCRPSFMMSRSAGAQLRRSGMTGPTFDALLAARSVLHREFQGFERQVRSLARRDDRARP